MLSRSVLAEQARTVVSPIETQPRERQLRNGKRFTNFRDVAVAEEWGQYVRRGRGGIVPDR